MAKKKALGKGLDALFGDEGINLDTLNKVEKDVDKEEIFELALGELRPNPYQPRLYFDDDALNELADSIKEHGIFQPLIVKEAVKGYEIVAGERRFRAASIAGLETVPVVVRSFTDQQMMEIALLENLQRENLNGIEEARAYELMIEKLNLTQGELAKRVGKSRTHITNILGILKLPTDVQQYVIDGKLSAAHARTLSKYDDLSEIRKIANNIIQNDLSVRDIEKIRSNKSKVNNEDKKDIHVIEAENSLCESLNTKVVIDNNKLVINYNTTDELNAIIEKLLK